MMETVIIHALWWLFGAASAFVAMFALAPVILSSRISASMRMQGIEDDEPEALTLIIPVDTALEEAQATARHYQELYTDYRELYLEEMDRAKLK